MESKMNLLMKIMPWVVGSLIAATPIFGDDNAPVQKRRSCEQGQKMTKAQMMPSYNAPARIDVRGSWDVFTSASFIYWQLSQENMQVAFADNLSNADYTTANQVQGSYVDMNFKYKPGFQVGLGINFDRDDWDAFAEYTRIHTTNTSSTNGTLLTAGSSAPLLPTWGHPYVLGTNVYNTGSESWQCNLDLINLDLGRVYYVGTQLTFRPFFGARSALIQQNVHTQYVNTGFSNGTGLFIEVPGVMNVVQRNHSWSIGPRVGFDTNWLFGQGLRFFGNANADLLYTKYKVQNKTSFVATSAVAGSGIIQGQNLFSITKEKPFALRTHLDLEMGLGWGSYFDNNNWYIDLSAGYAFQVFFDQNMLSTFLNSSMPGRLLNPHGNLYAQGLTATVRFDF